MTTRRLGRDLDPNGSCWQPLPDHVRNAPTLKELVHDSLKNRTAERVRDPALIQRLDRIGVSFQEHTRATHADVVIDGRDVYAKVTDSSALARGWYKVTSLS
jgi:hypothetical protein